MQENASHKPEAVERMLDSTLDSVDSAEELAVGWLYCEGLIDGVDEILAVDGIETAGHAVSPGVSADV